MVGSSNLGDFENKPSKIDPSVGFSMLLPCPHILHLFNIEYLKCLIQQHPKLVPQLASVLASHQLFHCCSLYYCPLETSPGLDLCEEDLPTHQSGRPHHRKQTEHWIKESRYVEFQKLIHQESC